MKTKKIGTCIGLLIGMSISMLIQTQLTTAMPIICEEFGTTSYYSWVYTAYMLASSVTIPLFGRICERYGNRKNYIIGGAIFFMGIFLSGVSKTMGFLIFSRAITGIGSGIVVPATYGIISFLFKKEDMRKVFGLMTLVQVINKGLGSVLGGIFSTYFTWRTGLFILLPITFVGLAMVIFTIKDTKRMESDTPINMKSAVLLTAALLVTMYGLENSSSNMSMLNVLILLTGILLIIGFIVREYRKESGILPAEILHSQKLKGLLLETLLLGAVLNACFVYLPMFMVQIFKWSTFMSGKVLLIYILTMGIVSGVFAFLKADAYKLVLSGWAIFLLGCMTGGLSYFSMSPMIFYLSNILLGVGIGILSSIIIGVMQAEIESSKASTNGIAHLMRNIGGTLGVTLLQVCLVSDMWLLFAGLFLLGFFAVVIQMLIVRERR